MNKFKGILFCTDLDGTLFCDDKTVSDENLKAIEYFKSEGGLFTFITGRPPRVTGDICDAVVPNAPYGCNNGGGIYDFENKKYLWSLHLTSEVFELINEVYEKLPEIGVQVNTDDEIYFDRDNAAMVRFRALTNFGDTFKTYQDPNEPITKIVFAHHQPEMINALSELLANHPLADKYYFIRSERTLYEILPKHANKGEALCKMAELFGISHEKTIAVGDYNNDVSMIKAAGVGFAVSNAVEEAKAVADYITVSNNENAIATIIDMLDKGKIQFSK